MNKVLVILGPTATGKTDLALQLAKKFDGELSSVDSRQVYVGLDIGTGKMPGKELSGKNKELSIKKQRNSWEVNGVKIWMYDVVSPKRQYSVADYVKDANKVIDGILVKGKLPIIVGGTGLYLKALLEGLPNLAIPVDLKLRKKLEQLSKEELQKKLQETSLKRWNNLNESDRENPRRLIRAIELVISNHQGDPSTPRLRRVAQDDHARDGSVLKIGLTAPREILYQRIDERVISRVDQGMISEAINLHKSGLSFKRMRQLGLEYGVLADYLSGKIGEIKGARGLIRIMQGKIHGYARRQLTWFKKEKDVNWFDITAGNFPDNVEKVITKWYHDYDATENRHLP